MLGGRIDNCVQHGARRTSWSGVARRESAVLVAGQGVAIARCLALVAGRGRRAHEDGACRQALAIESCAALVAGPGVALARHAALVAVAVRESTPLVTKPSPSGVVAGGDR